MKIKQTKAIAGEIVAAAGEKQAHNILTLDIREISTIADYFIICSGGTTRQAKAIYDEIEFKLSKDRLWPLHVEGISESKWVLMDYGDIIVHVFDDETREYYDLEGLWGDAPKVEF
jgi:ribosome-associated protein